jgi:hypothetical protein
MSDLYAKPSAETAEYERKRKRTARLRRRLRTDGQTVALQPGWHVFSTRVAHLDHDGRPACGVPIIDDGAPPDAPLSECRRCGHLQNTEDWSEFG